MIFALCSCKERTLSPSVARALATVAQMRLVDGNASKAALPGVYRS